MSNSLHRRQTGARLGIAIEALRKSQAEICRAFDVSPSKLGNWLRGDHYPDPYFIARLCDRYAITADWIYRGQVSGVGGALGDVLFAAAQASELAQPAEDRSESDDSSRGRPRRGRRPARSVASQI